MIIHDNSLAKTLDSINEWLFHNHSFSESQIEEVVQWLCLRQSKTGKQAGMFVPTSGDYKEGVRLFTGEKLSTKLAARNILTQEAARIVVLFQISSEKAKRTLEQADRVMFRACYAADYCAQGECRHSSIGFLRYLGVRPSGNYNQQIQEHIAILKQHRDGKGRWKGFPFYYTVLTLSEIDLPSALTEIHYALPACERALKRNSGSDKFSLRRQAVMRNAMTKIEDSKGFLRANKLGLEIWTDSSLKTASG